MNSHHKGRWRRALLFSLICVWTHGWVNNVSMRIWNAIALIIASIYCNKLRPELYIRQFEVNFLPINFDMNITIFPGVQLSSSQHRIKLATNNYLQKVCPYIEHLHMYASQGAKLWYSTPWLYGVSNVSSAMNDECACPGPMNLLFSNKIEQ